MKMRPYVMLLDQFVLRSSKVCIYAVLMIHLNKESWNDYQPEADTNQINCKRNSHAFLLSFFNNAVSKIHHISIYMARLIYGE